MHQVARQANKLSESCFATIDAFQYVALQFAICGGVKAREDLAASCIEHPSKGEAIRYILERAQKPQQVHVENDDEFGFGSSQLR